MNKVIISLQEYNSLKQKAEKWDKSEFSPELVNEKIKEDAERFNAIKFHKAMEIRRIKVDNIISDLYGKSFLCLTSTDWIERRLYALLDDLI
jgi:hypothetical protein